MPERAPDAGLHHHDIDALIHARHRDPFAVLGMHWVDGAPYVRAWLPNASRVRVLARDRAHTLAELTRVHPAGLFACSTTRRTSPCHG